MSKTEELLRRRDAVVSRGVGRLNGIAVETAEGATLTDADGRKLIDFATGIGVMGVGHGHPEVVDAIVAQARKLQHACIHVATYEPYVALCEKLAEKFPHGAKTKVQLINSGAEAVENAIKIARQATGRGAVICFTEAFHGRTLLCLTLTSKVGYKTGAGPFAPEVYRLPYPNYYRYGDGLTPQAFVERELTRFRQALVNTVPPSQVAAVILEVVQGEGGFVPCPGDYLRGLRKLCDEHGIMLICDEVQSGFCRTGRWSAYEHHGVTPDLSTWAKALGGGLPISAVIGKAEIMDKAQPGTLGGTYGGNPIACAAALAAIGVMEKQGLASRAEAVGTRIKKRLLGLKERCPLVGDVRGMGAMMAMELVLERDPLKPATAAVAEIVKGCLARGVLIITAGAASNIVRLLPPLTIPDAELEQGLDVLVEETMQAAAKATR